MRREPQTLVGVSNQRAALPGFARDEERATNIGRRSEQRTALPVSASDKERAANTDRRELHCQRGQGMRRELQTLVGGVNRELLCQ